MAIPSVVRVNGRTFTRNSVSVRVNGIIRLIDVDSIEWSDERPTELVPGMNNGGLPVGKAQGNYACDASISVYADAASIFETAINLGPSLPSDPTDLTSATFEMSIGMREDFRTRIVNWVNCTIKGRPSRTVANDGTNLVAQYAIQPLAILEDGKFLGTLIPAI